MPPHALASHPPALNVIVPLGGLGSRYSAAGYARAKPLVRVDGTEMLALLLRELSLRPADQLLIVYNPQPPHGIPEGYEQAIRDALSTSDGCDPSGARHLVRFVRLNGQTSGAAETVAYGLRALSPTERVRPTVLLDGDTVYHGVDVLQRFRDACCTSDARFAATATPPKGASSRGVGAVFVFHDDMEAPVYSYVRLASSARQGGVQIVATAQRSSDRAETHDAADIVSPSRQRRSSDDDGLPRIDCIKEKDKTGMSPLACSGCYCFAHGGRLLEAIEGAMSRSDLQDFQSNQCGKGELYTSGVIARMLREGETFVALILRAPGEDFAVLGTPSQLIAHLRASPPRRPKRFCFDLDGTLVTAPRVPGDYTTCEPIPAQVDNVRKLHAAGHAIIIHTARRMRTHGGNVGGVVADVGEITLQQLRAMGIPFDEMVFGKPYADFYVDDKAVSPFEDLEKETGVLLDANTCSPFAYDPPIAATTDTAGARYPQATAPSEDVTSPAWSWRSRAPRLARHSLFWGLSIAACACALASAPQGGGRLGEGIAYGALITSVVAAVSCECLMP